MKLEERSKKHELVTSYDRIEEISVKTGIDENRLKDLYFHRGSLEAYELLLIEKAVGKKQGELFEEFYGG